MLGAAKFANVQILHANARERGTPVCSRDYILWIRTERFSVNRYFFNFRMGDEISPDRIGMYLRDLDEARDEAVRTCRDLLDIAGHTGEPVRDCELQVADASGEPVLTIPLRHPCDTRH